jgi:hypothetical protein
MNLFRARKRDVCSIAILQEFLKETACTLMAKELVNDMVEGYANTNAEDQRLEAAMAVFKGIVPPNVPQTHI